MCALNWKKLVPIVWLLCDHKFGHRGLFLTLLDLGIHVASGSLCTTILHVCSVLSQPNLLIMKLLLIQIDNSAVIANSCLLT